MEFKLKSGVLVGQNTKIRSLFEKPRIFLYFSENANKGAKINFFHPSIPMLSTLKSLSTTNKLKVLKIIKKDYICERN